MKKIDNLIVAAFISTLVGCSSTSQPSTVEINKEVSSTRSSLKNSSVEFDRSIQTVGSTESSAFGEFGRGFKDGYKHAYPLGIPPIPPIPRVGKNTYNDGFVLGHARGSVDRP